MRTRARATALIVIGCAMGLMCAQAQTNETVVSRRNAAPRGCFYLISLKPLFPVKTPKEFSLVPVNVARFVFESIYTEPSKFSRIQPIKSNNVLSVIPVRPPMISAGVMEWSDEAPRLDLACGLIRGIATTSK